MGNFSLVDENPILRALDKQKIKRRQSVIKSPLNDPMVQDSMVEFCRACGGERYGHQTCYQEWCSAEAFYSYKQEHPELVARLDAACREYNALHAQKTLDQLHEEMALVEAKRKELLITGLVKETHVIEYLHEKKKDGSFALDKNGNAKIIGTRLVTTNRQVSALSLADLTKLQEELIEKADHAAATTTPTTTPG